MRILDGLKQLARHLWLVAKPRPFFPNVHPSAIIASDLKVVSPTHLYDSEDCNIAARTVILNGSIGRFTMKKMSFSARELLVIGIIICL